MGAFYSNFSIITTACLSHCTFSSYWPYYCVLYELQYNNDCRISDFPVNLSLIFLLLVFLLLVGVLSCTHITFVLLILTLSVSPANVANQVLLGTPEYYIKQVPPGTRYWTKTCMIRVQFILLSVPATSWPTRLSPPSMSNGNDGLLALERALAGCGRVDPATGRLALLASASHCC